jgi:hypothetical protein
MFRDGKWTRHDLSGDLLERWRSKLHDIHSPIGLIGLYNPVIDEFCLLQPGKRDAIGKKAIDWDFEDILLTLSKVECRGWNEGRYGTKHLDTPRHQLEKAAAWKKCLARYPAIPHLPHVLFFANNIRQLACDALFDVLAEKKLMFEDRNCGHQFKRRDD